MRIEHSLQHAPLMEAMSALEKSAIEAFSVSFFNSAEPQVRVWEFNPLPLMQKMNEHTLQTAKTQQAAFEAIGVEIIDDDVVLINDDRLPPVKIYGNNEFRAQVLSDLEKLLKFPATEALLSELKASNGDMITEISQAALDESDVDFENNRFIVTLTHQSCLVICKNASEEFVLEEIPSEITLAHELTHILHKAQGRSLHTKLDHTGFDTVEEQITIGELNVSDENLTENVYRQERGLSPRLGHFGITPDKLDDDESLAYLLKNALQTGYHFSFLPPETRDRLMSGLIKGRFSEDKDLILRQLDHIASGDHIKASLGMETLSFILGSYNLTSAKSSLINYAIDKLESKTAADFLINQLGEPGKFIMNKYHRLPS